MYSSNARNDRYKTALITLVVAGGLEFGPPLRVMVSRMLKWLVAYIALRDIGYQIEEFHPENQVGIFHIKIRRNRRLLNKAIKFENLTVVRSILENRALMCIGFSM